MSPARRRQMVDRQHPSLSLVRQGVLLGVSRSSLYYWPRVASADDLSLMGETDRQYLETPFFGSRRMKAWLERRGMPVRRKRVQRLMRAMGLRAIYRRPSTSRYVLAWRLSNTLEAGFCAEALEEALGQGQPEVFNTDQGSQFTSLEFTQVLQDRV